ncbi:MAG TPA: hypothetical protein VJG67_03630 [Candidatus Paceibacterota bacterium]
MQLSDEQLKILRQPFEEVGAFNGRSEEEIKKLLEDIADIYVALAKINLRSKQK